MHRVVGAALVGALVAVAGLTAVAGAAGGQDLAWARQFGTAASEVVDAVQVGSDGTVAVAGTRTGPEVVGQPFLRRFDQHGQLVSAVDLAAVGATTVAFSSDGGLVVAGAVPSPTGGSTDVLVQRYDPSGNEVWTQLVGTDGTDRPQGVASAADGSVYVVGLTTGRFEGEGPTGSGDAFVHKYGADGSHEWSRQFGTPADIGDPGHDEARGVAVDAGGDVLVTGTLQGSFGDGFLRRYDGAGNELWARQFDVNTSTRGNGVATDGLGNAYVVGRGGPAFRNFADGFVRKFDRDGTMQWTRTVDTPAASPDPRFGTTEEANAVAVDADGGVVIAGSTNGAFEGQTSAGATDAFVRSFDAAGEHRWTQQLGSSQSDAATAVAVADDGAVYVGGTTTGDLAGPNAGGADGFLARFGAPPPRGADLAVSVEPSQRNKRVTYTVTVANLGPDTATDVAFVDWLPARAKIVSVEPSQGHCVRARAVAWCRLGEVAGGATATVRLVVKTAGNGPVTNVVATSAPEADPDPDNNWVTTVTGGRRR